MIYWQENMIAHVDGEIVGMPPFQLKVLERKLRLRVRNGSLD